MIGKMYFEKGSKIEDLNLGQRVQVIKSFDCKSIPKIVRFFENPGSKFSLPGRCWLYDHDAWHVILDKDLDLFGEGYVIGFCMGSDRDTKWFHILIYKILSSYIYPKEYKFSLPHFVEFDAGFNYARNLEKKNLNQFDFLGFAEYDVNEVRKLLGIELSKLCLNKYDMKPQKKNLGEIFKWVSSLFGILGGFMLAVNLEFSPYGFIFLAGSSFSMLISSCINRDKGLIFYSLSIFLGVDLVGIYRWIIQ